MKENYFDLNFINFKQITFPNLPLGNIMGIRLHKKPEYRIQMRSKRTKNMSNQFWDFFFVWLLG